MTILSDTETHMNRQEDRHTDRLWVKTGHASMCFCIFFSAFFSCTLCRNLATLLPTTRPTAAINYTKQRKSESLKTISWQHHRHASMPTQDTYPWQHRTCIHGNTGHVSVTTQDMYPWQHWICTHGNTEHAHAPMATPCTVSEQFITLSCECCLLAAVAHTPGRPRTSVSPDWCPLR